MQPITFEPKPLEGVVSVVVTIDINAAWFFSIVDVLRGVFSKQAVLTSREQALIEAGRCDED